MKKNRTVLLGLNELNFNFIKFYIGNGMLPNFKKLFDIQKPVETSSENEYRLLEPWIQWVTVHTGKSYDEHKIFRLGDIVDNKHIPQIFEELENRGLSIGAVSPFNAENRLKNPSFFVPDPWTKTNASGSNLLKLLYKAIHQSVNDNARSKLNLLTIFSLLLGFITYVPFYRYKFYFKMILNLKNPGSKAVILDSILSDVFMNLWLRNKPNFSNLFLNSGAHIQHHYLFNSQAYKGKLKNPEWYCNKDFDPLIVVLSEYDKLIGRLLKIDNTKIIVATGLHQQPHEKITYYWRLNEHIKFCNIIGIQNYKQVLPRMSRDFLIKFDHKSDCKNAEDILNDYYFSIDGKKIFNVDNRGNSLFVELIYSNEINENDSIYSKKSGFVLEKFKSYISFVAIKNGEHNGTGYLSSNFELTTKNRIPLKELNKLIKEVALN